MDKIINQRELRNASATVLRDGQAGQTVIVTRNGEPIAELRPVQPQRFICCKTIAQAATRAPRLAPDRLRDELDAVIEPWADG